MFPIVKQIRSLDEYKAVAQAARDDNDAMEYPSHVVLRDGEIIGSAGIAVMPLLMVWNHTEKVRAAESMHLKRVYDSIMETKGFDKYFVACNKRSPYNGHMKKLGFAPIWETEIFMGGINEH